MRKKDKSVADFIPIAFYDKEKEFYRYKDGMIMDIFQIVPKDIDNLDEDEKILDNLKYEKFYKINEPSIKILPMNFPEKTEEQQEFYRRKIEKCKNPKFREELEISLEELKFIQENYYHREFILMVFANTEEEYRKVVDHIHETLGLGSRALCTRIDESKKEEVLCKIANKNL